ncbi:hypothetical protein [Rhizobium binxianense]
MDDITLLDKRAAIAGILERCKERLASIEGGERVFSCASLDDELIEITPNDKVRCLNVIETCEFTIGLIDEVCENKRRFG